jgi:hypothetical protein
VQKYIHAKEMPVPTKLPELRQLEELLTIQETYFIVALFYVIAGASMFLSFTFLDYPDMSGFARDIFRIAGLCIYGIAAVSLYLIRLENERISL